MDVNSMYFKSKANALKFLDSLLEVDKNDNDHYCDIHLYEEENAYIIEWEQVPYSGEWGGKFVHIDEDQYVFTEYRLPDNSYVYFRAEEEFNEYLKDWLNDNPGWVKNSWGMWTNEIENANFREELENNKIKARLGINGTEEDFVAEDDPLEGEE